MVHGGLLVVQRLFRRFCEARPRLEWYVTSYFGTALRVALTFTCVALAWVLFRAADFTTAMAIYRRAFAIESGLPISVPLKILEVLVCAVLVAHLAGRSGLWSYLYRRLPAPLVGFGFAVAIIVAMTIAPDSGKAFIYFQF